MTDASEVFEGLFSASPLMLILRKLPRAQTLELCRRAWENGIEAVEIPIQTQEALDTLEAAAALAAELGRTVGAGTVLTREQVIGAHERGARFTVAPGFDPEISAVCAETGIAHLPGVATGTEITHALKHGHTWMKSFPANVLGPSWIQAQLGPFPEVQFVATGGVSSGNLAGFLTAGARGVALGSAISDPDELGRCLEAVQML